MDKFQPRSPETEAHYEENIRGYADAAERLAKDYLWPQNIWKALMHEQGPNRNTLFADVVEELKRRKRQRKHLSLVPKPNQTTMRIVDQPGVFLSGAIQNEAFHAHRAEPPENSYSSEDRGDDF